MIGGSNRHLDLEMGSAFLRHNTKRRSVNVIHHIQTIDKSVAINWVSSNQKEQKMRKIFVITMLLLALTLTACGSNKVTLNITATDQGYDSHTYTVPAGAEVTVNMTNNGAVAHTFNILKLGEHVTPPYQNSDEDKILWELVAKTGETVSGVFTAPTQPGEYDIICRVPGHIQLGMTATLIVE
jgi:plastocyanin